MKKSQKRTMFIKRGQGIKIMGHTFKVDRIRGYKLELIPAEDFVMIEGEEVVVKS